MRRSAQRIWALRTVICAAFMGVLLLSGCGGREVATDCEVERGPCVKNIGEGLSVSFDINPKPLKTMSELLFSVILKKGDAPITVATVTLDLSMPGMYMAANRVSLSHNGEGVYGGKGVIVRCPGGRKVWRARIVAEEPGKDPTVAEYTFRVEK